MAWKEVTCLNISLCKHLAEKETSEYQVDYYIAVSCEAHGAWWSDSTAAQRQVRVPPSDGNHTVAAGENNSVIK